MRNTIKKEKDKLRLIAREEVEKFLVKRVVNDQRNFIQIDTTPNSKKHSAKAIDGMYIRSSNNSKAEAVYEYGIYCYNFKSWVDNNITSRRARQ